MEPTSISKVLTIGKQVTSSLSESSKEENSKQCLQKQHHTPTRKMAWAETQETATFDLVAYSFSDSADGRHLSPAGTASDTFSLSDPVMSPPGQSAGRPLTHRHLGDIKLPRLKDIEDEYSLGEISPIKVQFSSQRRQGGFEGDVGITRSPKVIRSSPPLAWNQTHHGDPFSPSAVSNPFYVIRSAYRALSGCKYTLPCLQGVDLCPVRLSAYGHVRQYRSAAVESGGPTDDSLLGTQRVEASICAFGGTLRPKTQRNRTMPIFRVKKDPTRSRQYEVELARRYTVTGSQISWDVEEDPPVPATSEREERYRTVLKQGSSNDADDDYTIQDNLSAQRTHTDSDSLEEDSAQETDEQKGATLKNKYRCKLCGQPKQNHSCPYRPSLQRSIGVMVWPAVNSYTAAEPGRIATSLTKMNNFVSYDSDQNSNEQDQSSLLTAPSAPGGMAIGFHPSTVTPETRTFFHLPNSPLSAHSADYRTGRPASTRSVLGKRAHEHMGTKGSSLNSGSPFVASVTLRPEHYRSVTKVDDTQTFIYPAIPLTFSERKRLSDTLFYLSRETPSMTRDCANVLRSARENDEWDLAVAELLTQVIIGLYCVEEDSRLDGLQRYLLTMGISC